MLKIDQVQHFTYCHVYTSARAWRVSCVAPPCECNSGRITSF